MITFFLIWLAGALIVAILLQGHLEWLEHNYKLRTDDENDLGFIAACIFSIVSLVIILVGIWKDYQEHPNTPEKPYRFPWKFPIGKHYAEFPDLASVVPLCLAGTGSMLLIHGVETESALLNISLFIAVVVSFSVALMKTITQKQFFWAVAAMLVPFVLDTIFRLQT